MEPRSSRLAGSTRSGFRPNTSSGPGAAAEQSRSRRRRLCSALGACIAIFVVLAATVATHLRATWVDRLVWRDVVDDRGGSPIALARVISHLGDPLVLLLIAGLAGVWLARRRSIVAGLAPAVALVAASVTETVMKQIVGRSRPPAFARLVAETDPSFPSGHTTGTAALLVAIALVAGPVLARRAERIGAVVVAGAVALAVGCARIVLGVHWVTDVVAGWFLGVGWAIAVTLVLPEIERRLARPLARTRPTPEPVRPGPARTSSADAW